MKTLVLVGGGHAHLYGLRQLILEGLEDVHVLLISTSRFQYYSGMFSGFAEGFYDLEETRIDLQKMCQKAGAIFIEDRIVQIDADNKEMVGTKGKVYTYDAASFDIGSETAVPNEWKDLVSTVKPNFRFSETIASFRKAAYPTVVGGGASGVELALAILAWRKQHHLLENVAVVGSSPLLAAQGEHISKKIEAIAQRKGLQILANQTVIQIDKQSFITSSGSVYPQSEILWLTGPASPALFRHSKLPIDSSGFLLLNEFLQSDAFPSIFGAGDCASIKSYPSLAKNGVYAVRQGPVLWENLQLFLFHQPLKPFVPQKRFLSILSTGNQEALLLYGKRSIHGKWPWLLKQHIDRKFMKTYQKLYE